LARDLFNNVVPSKHQTVAVVAASRKPERHASQAMRLLAQHGRQAIPVNPAFDEIEGEKCYPSVGSLPEPIDTITMLSR
jgi:predicted CoA-binding protein